MNNENRMSVIYFIVSIIFYIVAIMRFTDGDSSSGGSVWICLGSAFLCLGSMHAENGKKADSDEKTERQYDQTEDNQRHEDQNSNV